MRLVLLPGMDGTGELFREFAKALPYDTLIVPYPTERFLSYVELETSVRDACLGSEPFVLIAESFSTPLAIQYAAAKPDNLQGLVLCAGFAASPLHGPLRFLVSIFAPLLVRLPLPDFVANFWLVGKGAPASLLAELKRAILSVHPDVLAARLKATLACDVLAQLNHIHVPVLYIQATEDRLVPPSCVRVIRRRDPRVKVATARGAHLILQREPNTCAKIVTEYVRGLAPACSSPPIDRTP